MYQSDSTLLQKAQYYTSLSWHVFPVYSISDSGSCTCYRPDCSDPGKHPRTLHGFKDSTTDPDQLAKFFRGRDNQAGIAIATGSTSGVWLLDIDNKPDRSADETLRLLQEQHGPLPATPYYRTGGGGYQYVFRLPSDGLPIPCSESKIAQNVDVRGENGYSILPESKHKSGGAYSWVVDPDSVEIADAPDWLVALARGEKPNAPNTPTPPSPETISDGVCVAGEPNRPTAFTIESGSGEVDNVERVRRWLAKIPIPEKGNRKEGLWQQSLNLLERIDDLTEDEIYDGSREWVEQFGAWDSESDQRYQIKRAIKQHERNIEPQRRAAIIEKWRNEPDSMYKTPRMIAELAGEEFQPPTPGLRNADGIYVLDWEGGQFDMKVEVFAVDEHGNRLPDPEPVTLQEETAEDFFRSIGLSEESPTEATTNAPETFRETPTESPAEIPQPASGECPQAENEALYRRLDPEIDGIGSPGVPIPYSIPVEKPEGFPELPQDALYGFVGDFVKHISPYTEADPAALLMTFLTQFGSAIGRGPHFVVNGDMHRANLYCAIVGQSSKARKGTSAGCIRELFRNLDAGQSLSGLSSGEGLISFLRDDPESDETKDKRCFVVESEFARILSSIQRNGNTLSEVLRDAWDRDTLAIITRNNPLTASDCHVSILAHITEQELVKAMPETEATNGFANRFIWIASRRSKLLPEAGELPPMDLLRDRLKAIIAKAQTIGKMTRDEAGAKLWREAYVRLSEEKSSKAGPYLSRAEAQVLRLSMVYALLDGSEVIGEPHVRAAIAVWQYSEETAMRLFDRLGATEARILDSVKANPGIKRNDLRNSVSKKLTNAEYDPLLESLEERGLIYRESEGRAEKVYPVEAVAKPDPVVAKPPGETMDLFEISESSKPTIAIESDMEEFFETLAASIGDLIEWKNQAGASVYFDEERGLYWLTKSEGLSKSLTLAIEANQDTLAALA